MRAGFDRTRHKIETAKGRAAFFSTIGLGAISVIGHAPFFIWPIFVLALAVFMGRLNGIIDHANRPGRAAFWSGWAFGFGFFVAGLYWLASAFITRGGGYVWLTPLGVIALPAVLAFFWAFTSLLYVKACARINGRLRYVSILVFSTLFFLMEWLRGHIFSGFPWNLPGYIWEAGKPVSQIAYLISIYGLSFLTFFLGAALGYAFFSKTSRALPRLIPLSIAALIFGGIFLHGQSRLSSAEIDYVEGPYIRVVQAQIDQKTKYDPNAYSRNIDHYLDLSVQASEQPITHILWPEGAIAGLVLEDPGLIGAFDQIFAGGPQLLMGVTRRVPKEDGYNFYNSLVALKATGTGTMSMTASYDKFKLVPFGEYFPGNKLFKEWELDGLTKATASFDRGKKDLTAIPGLPVGSVQICYEAIFSGFTPHPQDSSLAPNFILNISNDSWFGRSTGPHQHFNQVKYRAIEEGLPLIRSASSGFSGFVDPYGRVLAGAGLSDNTTIDHRLPKPLNTSRTAL